MNIMFKPRYDLYSLDDQTYRIILSKFTQKYGTNITIWLVGVCSASKIGFNLIVVRMDLLNAPCDSFIAPG